MRTAPTHKHAAGPVPGRRAFLAGAGAALLLGSGGEAIAQPAWQEAATAFPFGMPNARAVAIPAGHPWIELSRRHRRQEIAARLAAPDGGDAWTRFVNRLAQLPQAAAIDALHSALHRVAYVADDRAYRRSDVWATPREFLGRGGDCEDFAVAAWLALAGCGVPAADLRLIVGRLRGSGAAHAVTALRTGAGIAVFDMRADGPVRYRPFDALRLYYSLSGKRLWLHRRSRTV